jgi:hydroxyacylglutathione hydrolase
MSPNGTKITNYLFFNLYIIIKSLPFLLPTMLHIQTFTFNPFQENTYILFDDTKECIIVDPGCYEFHEKNLLKNFIEENGLHPVKLLNTHCHIDHVLGNSMVEQLWELKPVVHKGELPILRAIPAYAPNYGIRYEVSPEPEEFLEENDMVKFGMQELKVIFTPGHSPGSISFYHMKENFILSGDVLFYRSIGRTDLRGGDFETLIHSIKTKLFVLPEDTLVYSGHGPTTTIGAEKLYNPFV